MKDSIESILKIKFVGNYRDDAHKFERITRYQARKDVPLILKWAAENHANCNGMGERAFTFEEYLAGI